jgi:hypothetical protein
MKYFLLILIFVPFLSRGQKLALIDRSFHQPIGIADSVSMEEVAKGILPVYYKDMPSIISAMQWLLKYMGDNKVHKEEILDLKVGDSKCIVQTKKNGSTNRYHIVLNSKTTGFKTSIVLVAHETNKRATQRIAMFMDYLRNNASVMEKL